MTQASPLIKICGITRQEDADACVTAGVDMIGFIFHPASPRYVDPDAAGQLSSGGALRVGVFVHQSQDEVLDIVERARLDLVQLTGDQDRAFCKAVGPQRVMRVFWPERYRTRAVLEGELERYEGCAGYALLDAGMAGGGSGLVQNFEFLKGLQSPMPWFVAGGLSLDTLPQAMTCGAVGYDLNSGLEISPGIKDPERINRAVGIIRGAS